ncbi:MAG: hypothetical protein Q9224_001230 [Gallowayella concinna]
MDPSEPPGSSDNEDVRFWYGVSPGMRPNSRQVDWQSARDEKFLRHSSLVSYTEMYNSFEFFVSVNSPTPDAEHHSNILPSDVTEYPIMPTELDDGANDDIFLNDARSNFLAHAKSHQQYPEPAVEVTMATTEPNQPAGNSHSPLTPQPTETMSPIMECMSPMMGSVKPLSPLRLDIDSTIQKQPEATASSTTENENNFQTPTLTADTVINLPDLAHVIDESDPNSCPSNGEEMLRGVLRGGKVSSDSFPSSHSHSVRSFSPRHLNQKELHSDPGSNLFTGAVNGVGAMMHISDSDESASNSDSGATCAVPKSRPRFGKLGHLEDRDARDVGDLLHHRASSSDSVYPTRVEHGDQQMTNPISQSIHGTKAGAITNVNTATKVAEAVDPNTAKVKKRHNDSSSLEASLIASTPHSPSTFASPRRTKRVKLDALTEPENPFENFNSGSEPEDDDDVDFDALSASPSLRSKSPSPEPTPPDSGDELPVAKGKAKGRRQQAAVKVKKTRKSSVGFGDWPVASQARRMTSNSYSSTVTAAAPAERTNQKAWPLASEALRAANRGVNVSGIPNLTSAGHDHETSMLLTPKTSPANNNHRILAADAILPDAASMDSVIEAENRSLYAQRLEVEKEAEIENKKLQDVERDVEKLKDMLDGEDVVGVEGGRTRNGGEWTLVIEMDEYAQRVGRWKFG